MSVYEYTVVPAPKRGLKARGVKSTEDRFAHALAQVMNEHGAMGWEYLRTDTLPCDERSGLTGTKTTFQSMLVFRKAVAVETTAHAPEMRVTEPAPAPLVTPIVENKPLAADPARPEPRLAAE